MAGSNDAPQIQFFCGGNLTEVPGTVSDVVESARPSTARIAHTAILEAPGRDTGFGESSAQMTNMLQSISSAPVAAVDDNRHWMRSSARGNTQFTELEFTGTVGELFAVRRRRQLKNALRCAGGHFEQGNIQD